MRYALFLLSFCSAVAHAGAELDWESAEHGIEVEGRVAYAGCASLAYAYGGVMKARRIAHLRAQSNMAKASRLEVDGGESASGDRYSIAITEYSASYLRPIEVIQEGITFDGSDSRYCVLASEVAEEGSVNVVLRTGE